MKQHKKPSVFIAGILTALLLAGLIWIIGPQHFANVQAQVQPSEDFETRALVQDVLVIPAASFRNDGNDPAAPYFWFNGGYWYGNDSYSTCFMAPVYVPDGVNIYQVWATVFDNDGVNDLWISLYRQDNYTGIVSQMASMASAGESTSLASAYDISVNNGKVSYPQYSYYLGTCLSDSNHRLYNVRVWYEFSYMNYLPILAKSN